MEKEKGYENVERFGFMGSIYTGRGTGGKGIGTKQHLPHVKTWKGEETWSIKKY